jgi:hypothetical protein
VLCLRDRPRHGRSGDDLAIDLCRLGKISQGFFGEDPLLQVFSERLGRQRHAQRRGEQNNANRPFDLHGPTIARHCYPFITACSRDSGRACSLSRLGYA